MRGRSKFVQVDNALTAFHAVPADCPGTALIALKAVVRQCEAYVQHKEGKAGPRRAGVSELQQQAGDGRAKFRTLAAFNELDAKIDRLLERGANPDTYDRALAAAAQEASRGIPSDDFHTTMEGQVRALGALSGDPDLPAETRGIIGELMAAAQRVTRMQVPMNGMPGMKITAGEGQSASSGSTSTPRCVVVRRSCRSHRPRVDARRRPPGFRKQPRRASRGPARSPRSSGAVWLPTGRQPVTPPARWSSTTPSSTRCSLPPPVGHQPGQPVPRPTACRGPGGFRPQERRESCPRPPLR